MFSNDFLKNKKYNLSAITVFVVLLALIYFPIFQDLGRLPIRIWDEARLAVSAQEMYLSGDYIVPTSEGRTDEWNLKPPLMLWCQVVCMKFIGWNEIAIRLPSAISSLLLCLFLFFFSLKFFQDIRIGFLACLVLVTSHGFINVHASRTGDYDAMLTLFSTLFSFSFFAFIESTNESSRSKWISLSFAGLILGVYTKSIVILMMAPPLLIYTLYRRKLMSTLKDWRIYLGIIIFLLLVGAYYFGRESINPGYLKLVRENEWGGRYFKTIEEHSHGFWYYFDNFKLFQFKKWFWILPISLILTLLLGNLFNKRLAIFSSICAVFFFLSISFAETKLEWYDLPLYPFMAVLIATGFATLFDVILKLIKENDKACIKILMYIVIIVICFFDPYKTIIKKVYKQNEYAWDVKFYELSYFLKDKVRNKQSLNNHQIYFETYHLQLLFYTNILKMRGQNVDYVRKFDDIREGMLLVVDDSEIRKRIQEKYNINIIENSGNVDVINIQSSK